MRLAHIGAAALAGCVLAIGPSAEASIWVATCPGSGLTTLTLSPTTINPLSGGTFFSFAADSAGGSDAGATGSGTTAGAPDALGALLGTPSQGTEAAIQSDFGVTLAGGDVVVLDGLCVQDVELKTGGVTLIGINAVSGNAFTIAPLAAPPSAATIGNNGIQGNVILYGVERITFDELLLGSASGTVTLNATTSLTHNALLFSLDSQLFMINSLIQGSPNRGALISSTSTATLESDTITENGVGNTNPVLNSGLQIFSASSVIMGDPSSGDFPTVVSNNAGDGIEVGRSGSLSLYGGTITGNGQKQIFVFEGSSVLITGSGAATSSVAAPAGNTDTAIAVGGASALRLEAGASVEGGTGAGSYAIAVSSNSTAVLQGVTVWGGVIPVEINGSSSVFLAGGNLICSGSVSGGVCTPGGGTAFDVRHVGALVAQEGTSADSGFAAAADTVFGAGAVEMQSTVDLGTGIQNSSPSITWTTGAGGIAIAQNSSLRLQGGVQINGAIAVGQGSNGFFNKTAGGTNNVSGGVSCTGSSSHVVGPAAVTPTPVTIVSSGIGCYNF